MIQNRRKKKSYRLILKNWNYTLKISGYDAPFLPRLDFYTPSRSQPNLKGVHGTQLILKDLFVICLLHFYILSPKDNDHQVKSMVPLQWSTQSKMRGIMDHCKLYQNILKKALQWENIGTKLDLQQLKQVLQIWLGQTESSNTSAWDFKREGGVILVICIQQITPRSLLLKKLSQEALSDLNKHSNLSLLDFPILSSFPLTLLRNLQEAAGNNSSFYTSQVYYLLKSAIPGTSDAYL